ncbi:MAG: flagellar export protein FliJ [Burkholderiales bacterium]|nr:flagellar export protein FliJ [Burkholderiales bacterium]
MTARFSLQPVMDLARENADAAAARLGQAMQRLLEADRQLKTLLDYREEYQARLRDSVTSGIDSAGWRNFHLFLAKLDAGIEGARAHADSARELARRAQVDWHDQQRKLKAYGVLAQRHERAQQTRAARQEQRETDEHAANRYSRNASPHRPR